MRGNSRQKLSHDAGIALITALMLLAVMGTVTAAAVALGVYLQRDVVLAKNDAVERYAAESALNRMIFYLKRDVAAYPTRTLGSFDYHQKFAVPRYMADGTAHELNVFDRTLKVTVSDASGGFSWKPFDTLIERLKERREYNLHGETVSWDEEWAFSKLLNRIEDFLDEDDDRRLDGMESAEYRELGLAFLPRSQTPEYAEEMFWIPGIRDCLPGNGADDFAGVQLIEPAGMAEIPQRVALFSSPADRIGVLADLSKEEVEKLGDALERWRNEQTLLEDSLSEDIYKKIITPEEIQTEESGIYAITVNLPGSTRCLKAVFSLTGGTAFLEFYEYSFR